jgi:23S rRNA (pseudouridine1915-N3)-methyltransferase
MKLDILAVGKNMPAWVNQGVSEYLKRFPAHFHCELHEIAPAKRIKNGNVDTYKQQEAQTLLSKITPSSYVIALEVTGQAFTTEQLAKHMQKWLEAGRNIQLVIGGPDGLAHSCLERAELHWSLSPLTFPHPLVRIILAEQLYRGWSLLNNHPYHRE